MSTNNTLEIHVFTEKQLKERDRKIAETIAKEVSKASVIHTARKMVKMNSGQQLKAMTHDCKNLHINEKKINKMVDHFLEILED